MIYEWSPSGDHPFLPVKNGARNFGDALWEIIVPDSSQFRSDMKNVWFFSGSVICNTVIREVIGSGYNPVFIRCGWRGEDLDLWDAIKCRYIGVRGPDTHAALGRIGIDTEVKLDPGYDIPDLVPAGKIHGKALLYPHIQDGVGYDIDSICVDEQRSTVVKTKEDILQTIADVSGASFIITSSLHIAIIAHAYGVPFGLFDADKIDCPAKWKDWARSVDITNLKFCDNVVDALIWHQWNVPPYKKN